MYLPDYPYRMASSVLYYYFLVLIITVMTAKLTTHVLDTYNGKPASGVSWNLEFKSPDGSWVQISSGFTNEDGRTSETLISGEDLITGCYRLSYDVSAYFNKMGVQLSDPPFLGKVVLQVNLVAGESYHVPLLCSPWSYSTYRGS